MKNKNNNIYKTLSLSFIVFSIILFVVFLSMVKGNNNQVENSDNQISQKQYDEISLEVYHFHGTDQCSSCIAVGDLAEKTLNTYFKEELDSGKIKFAHINAELAENYELAKKYGVTGSSLWIGTYLDGQFHKEENVNVWYKINNEQDYMTYLKGELDKRLNGDLS